jgi:hypothetical protein
MDKEVHRHSGWRETQEVQMKNAGVKPNRMRPRLRELPGIWRALILNPVLVLIAFTGCEGRNVPVGKAQILLFNGTGTSPNDVTAFETILKSRRADYVKVNSAQLNSMSQSQMQEFSLFIVPGGNFIKIGNGLSHAAASNIRSAVQNGLNYLGVCAGAFLAGSSPSNGFNLTSGVKFGFYSAEERGIRKAAVPIAVPGYPTLEHYWEDGPQLAGWGTVVGKYPDGTPAIVQGTCGSGWVILSGVHPEAPANWRRGMNFTTLASTDNAYAWNLIQAALNREMLPHY